MGNKAPPGCLAASLCWLGEREGGIHLPQFQMSAAGLMVPALWIASESGRGLIWVCIYPCVDEAAPEEV